MARIAVAGGGRMATRHVQALMQEGHTLAALIDPAESPFALQQGHNISEKHLRNLEQLPSDSADVLIISTTANHRLSLLTGGLERGIRRFVIEKPFSQSVAEGRHMHSLAEQYQARIVVNHGRRYCPNIAALKKLESSGNIGSLRMISLRMGGGSLGCVGTHWIDLCINLMDAVPERVACMMTEPKEHNIRGESFFDPGGTALLFFPDGRRAHIDHGDDVGIIAGADFVYELGKVSWEVEAGEWCLHRRRAEDIALPMSRYSLPLERSLFPSTTPDVVAYASAALHDALSSESVSSGTKEAIATMEVYAACRTAATEQKVVPLPIPSSVEARTFLIP